VTATRKMVLAGLGVFATALVLALWTRVRHQQHERSALIDCLTRAASADGIAPIGSRELDKLPAPASQTRSAASERALGIVAARGLAQLGHARPD